MVDEGRLINISGRRQVIGEGIFIHVLRQKHQIHNDSVLTLY